MSVDLLVRDAHVYVDRGWEIANGWVAVKGTELTDRRVNAGIAGEAGGSMLAALIDGFGTTAYAQNLGVIRLMGVASRHVVRVAGIIFIVLAFLPKVAAILVATPAALSALLQPSS